MNQLLKLQRTRPETPARKLRRAEKNEETKRRLFSAAAKIVGQYGYAGASVARITAVAGVAQGTFYNHFVNRQALLDQLLPAIGETMLNFIQTRIEAAAPAAVKEIERCRAFFDFLLEVPEFLRILNEAEFFAPTGYQQHLNNIVAGYLRVLKRARTGKKIENYSDEELEVIVHILMGARGYLSRRYAYQEGSVRTVPDYVLSAYFKLMTRGLFPFPET